MINFIETKEHRRFVEFCEACRKYGYIGICHGAPGVGKTLSAQMLSSWFDIKPILDSIRGVERRELSIKRESLHTLFYTAPTFRTSRINNDLHAMATRLTIIYEQLRRQEDINYKHDFTLKINETASLIIVDEVDRLKLQGLEVLREVFDESEIGMVMIGMPGMEKRLARYPQLYSRIGFSHEYRSLSKDELQFILQNRISEFSRFPELNNFDDYEAIMELTRITNGNFRLIDRMLAQSERIMKINGLSKITKEVIETARKSLVIGK